MLIASKLIVRSRAFSCIIKDCVLPWWRNWYTRESQKLMVHKALWVRVPPTARIKMSKSPEDQRFDNYISQLKQALEDLNAITNILETITIDNAEHVAPYVMGYFHWLNLLSETES